MAVCIFGKQHILYIQYTLRKEMEHEFGSIEGESDSPHFDTGT